MAVTIQVLVESLSFARVAFACFVLFVTSLAVDFVTGPTYPSSFPHVGHGKGLVASVRNYFGYYTDFASWLQEGYEKYSKHDRPFVIMGAFSRPPSIILPQSQTMWMLEQSDKAIGTREAHNDFLYSEFNFLGKRLCEDMYHERVIHKSLARALPSLIPSTQEEVQRSVDEVFGMDTENWTGFNLWESWLSIVPKVTNRMLVGAPINRNPELLSAMVEFTNDVVRNMFLLSLTPTILHPIAGPLYCIPNRIHHARGAKYTLPIIKQRLEDMTKKERGDPLYRDWVEPEDFITWTIRVARADGNAFELDPDTISKRLLPIEFAAIHTTMLTGHAMLLDLVSSDPELGYLEELREEATRVFAEQDGQWTKDSLGRLYRIDSAIRESQRYSNFALTMVERKVVAPEGITNKTEGYHIPYGNIVSLNLRGLHRDGEKYEDPDIYNPLRFSKPREEFEAKSAEDRDPVEGLKLKKTGMVSTNENHLAFGHGRHACPGRFFVAHELKMALAHIVMNYDIKHLPSRPKTRWIGQTIIPALDAKIELRRKKGTVPVAAT